jgi:hypothetical protein
MRLYPYICIMKKSITSLLVIFTLSIGSVFAQCTDNGTLKNSGASDVFLFSDIINCPNGDVTITDAGGNGVLRFASDVTLNSLNIVFQNGNKPITIEIPSGVTVTITQGLTFGGQPDKDKFLVVEGNLNVGETLDFGSIQFEIDGTGTISAKTITGGGDTTCSPGSGGSGTCPTMTAESCSGGGVCNDGNFTLPIVLKSFEGEVKFERVVLSWVTAKEENFSHFEIERTTDKEIYDPIGFVQGLGESLSDVSYDFTDNNPPYGNINYRLKSVDIDGSFEYSPIIQVINSFEGKVNLSPNPANSISNIRINLPSSFNDKVDLVSIYDLNGTLISQLMNVDASSDLKFDRPLKAGMYIIKVQHNGAEENLRLLVQ